MIRQLAQLLCIRPLLNSEAKFKANVSVTVLLLALTLLFLEVQRLTIDEKFLDDFRVEVE